MIDILLPFSKSEINRLFILAFQAKRPFVISNFSFCDDTKVIYDFYNQLQVDLKLVDNDLIVDASNVKFTDTNLVNVYQAGTAFRFLISLCSTLPYHFRFIGHEALSKRPISSLTETLSQLGIIYCFENPNQSLPLTFRGKHIINSQLEFDKAILSSQFISSILLLAPSLPLNFNLKFRNTIISDSYVNLTLRMLEKLGILWVYNRDNQTFTLQNNTFTSYQYFVSADWTNASYFIALSALLRVPIRLPNLTILSYQPDVGQLSLWIELGVQFCFDNEIDLVVNPSNFEMREWDWDFSSIPDLFQTFAVLTAYHKGIYRFVGLQSLQYKETHRLMAVKNELQKIGIEVSFDEYKGECIIRNDVNRYPENVVFKTYNDHRMAMAFSLLKPLITHIEFDNQDVVNKSFPNFWCEYSRLLA